LCFEGGEKQSQFKANLTAFGRKSEARNLKRVERVLFEKTNPICAGTNWRKILIERILWQFVGPRGTKKQSQTKPIY
jgi:hypothetical protein